MQCTTCGFYYSVYSRPKKILDKIYVTAYRDSSSSWRTEGPEEIFRKVIALPRSQSETKYRVQWIKENIKDLWNSSILKKQSPPLKILDIGGGSGVFAYEFQDREWKTYIIDPSENNSFIKTKLKIPLVQKLYKPNAFGIKFNLVTLIYVLEHVLDPKKILLSVRQDLTKNSLIYIEIPDSAAFRLKPKNDDIFNSCHLWMFDPKSVSKLLDICGFEIFKLNRLKTLRGHYSLMVLAGKR